MYWCASQNLWQQKFQNSWNRLNNWKLGRGWFMYMKPIKAGKTYGCVLKTLNQKLKKKRADTSSWWQTSFFWCVIYDKFWVHISIKLLFIWRLQAPIPLRFRWSSDKATCSTLKPKLFDIYRRSHPVKFYQ